MRIFPREHLVVPFAGSVFALAGAILTITISFSTAGPKKLDWPILVSGVLLTGVAIIVGGILCRKIQVATEEPQKPRVHVWTHDGVIILSPDRDFELELEVRERNKLAYPEQQGWQRPWPDKLFPRLFALFVVKEKEMRNFGGLEIHGNPSDRIGTMAMYDKLVENCQVIRSEMNVPRGPISSVYPLSMAGIWRLVHGPAAKPPELEKTS